MDCSVMYPNPRPVATSLACCAPAPLLLALSRLSRAHDTLKTAPLTSTSPHSLTPGTLAAADHRRSLPSDLGVTTRCLPRARPSLALNCRGVHPLIRTSTRHHRRRAVASCQLSTHPAWLDETNAPSSQPLNSVQDH
ncbi:hypothetical protein CC78DRAFT_97243 [Lojkania enalia]|uniref:Uncharacterized protein n=1 Tax=Lojkania enalia TaxID=147567 RepID=A0A9P4JZL5_9PLEO|nr:hypothetical protein CC78DRAFT_97243 [Didymosphaeria enalia]